MQEISAYISGNRCSLTASGALTDEYADEALHVVVLSNLVVKAARVAFLFREAVSSFADAIPPETAFILCDKVNQQIYFGTDAYAVKPIFYALQSGNLLIHSNLNDLLVFSETHGLNVAKTTDYFKWESNHLPADNETFYQGIYRLLPAQVGVFQAQKLSFFHNPTISVKTPLLRENHVAASFKLMFENAVSQRNVNVVTAANLSGGLDSSSVVSVLSSQLNQPLYTVYYNAKTTLANEQAFASAVAQHYETRHREVTAPVSLLDSLIAVTQKIAQPDPGEFPSFIHDVIFDAVELNDSKRLFSGHGGNHVVGYGLEYLDDLIENNAWRKLKEAGKNYDLLRQSKQPVVGKLFKQRIRVAVGQQAWGRATKLALICLFYFGIVPLPKRFFQFKDYGNQLPEYERFECKLLKTQPVQNSSNSQYFTPTEIPKTFTENQRKHLDFNFIRLAINGNEVLSILGHYRDVGVSFPFFDRELLGVAVQATEKQKFANGYLRGTLRNGLAAYLPKKVANRVSKADFTTAAITYFEAIYEDFRVAFPLNHELWEIVNAAVFQELVEVVLNDCYAPPQKVKHTWLAMRVINFGVFLAVNKQHHHNNDDE